MASAELKSKVLNFTYVLMGLTIIGLILDLFSSSLLSVLIDGAMLCLMFYFIKGVKENKVSYMKPYKIFLIIYSAFLVIGIIMLVCVMLGVTVIGTASLVSTDLGDEGFDDGEKGAIGIGFIINVVIAVFYVVYAILVLCYIRLVEKYYNQVKQDNKELEQNKNLEANTGVTNN